MYRSPNSSTYAWVVENSNASSLTFLALSFTAATKYVPDRAVTPPCTSGTMLRQVSKALGYLSKRTRAAISGENSPALKLSLIGEALGTAYLRAASQSSSGSSCDTLAKALARLAERMAMVYWLSRFCILVLDWVISSHIWMARRQARASMKVGWK